MSTVIPKEELEEFTYEELLRFAIHAQSNCEYQQEYIKKVKEELGQAKEVIKILQGWV